MFKLVFVLFLLFATGFGTHANAAGCEPSLNQVTLYQHSNYRGACSVLDIGYYKDSAAMRIANDSVSSIKVGSNVSVYVARHSFRGNTGMYKKRFMVRTGEAEQIFTSSIRNLNGSRVGNDSISSASVFVKEPAQTFKPGDCYPGDNSTSIAIYQHPNFWGNCRVLDLGTYKNSTEMNFKNDSVSSVELGRNSKVYVEIYSGSNFKGRSQTLTSSENSLSTGAVGDNKLTSIKVLRK